MKKIMIGVMTVALVAAILPNVSSAAQASGQNYVSVDTCRNVDGGIMVRRFGNAVEYKLSNGVRDAGHGMRNYMLKCVGNKTYFVTWSDVTSQPEQPTVPGAQPKADTVKGYTSNWYGYGAQNTPLFSVNRSYRDTNGYFSLGNPITIASHVDWVTGIGALVPDDGQQGNLTYGFAWQYSATDNLKFDYDTTRNLTQWAQTRSVPEYTAPVFDSYRGGYVLVLVYVRNNDGYSAVPGMKVEVDDVVPIYVYLEPKAPTMSCGNSAGGNGLYSACVGDSITHTNGLHITVEDYTKWYVKISSNGNMPYGSYIWKNGSKYVQYDGVWYTIRYTNTTDKHGAFLQIDSTNLQ